MTLNDFVANNKGEQLADPSGGYKGECVSLWKQFELQVNGIDPADLYVPSGAAKNIWYETTPSMFKHFNKDSGGPQIGDTVVYDGNLGDVAIYIGNNQVFGQLGTPVFQPAAIRPIGSPLGFLRLIGQGDDMPGPGTADNYTVEALAVAILGRTASGDKNLQNNIGRPVNDVIDTFRSYPEAKERAIRADAPQQYELLTTPIYTKKG